MKTPGLYYEQADGDWVGCPCSRTADAALILITYRPPLDRLEVVLGGFSGRATRCLTGVLHAFAGKLWPPKCITPQLEIGAFVVQFTFPAGKAKGNATLPSQPSAIEVIPLDEEVIKRRLKK
jgi:hypothetical protein